MRRLTLCMVFFGLASFGPVQDDVVAEALYWVDSDGIYRLNLDGSAVRRIVSDISEPSGIAVDSIARKIYWTDELPTEDPDLGLAGRIRRANLDGSDMETVLELDVAPEAIALRMDSEVPAGGEMYWLNRYPKEGLSSLPPGNGVMYLLNRNLWDVRRASLDGTDQQILAAGFEGAKGLAIDEVNRKVYWTSVEVSADWTGMLLRANLDGSHVESVIPEAEGGYLLELGLGAPRIAFDSPNGNVYLGCLSLSETLDADNPTRWSYVLRSNPDGSEADGVVYGMYRISGMTFDSPSQTLYWSQPPQTDSGEQYASIHRLQLSAWEHEVLVTGLQEARSIALGPAPIPEPSTLLMLGSGGLAMAALTCCRGRRKAAYRRRAT